MVDLHCHILPGLDDGPDRMEESLEMAETAIADGLTHVVATPHSNERFWFDFAHVRRLRDELQNRIGNRLTMATGCDFHLNTASISTITCFWNSMKSPSRRRWIEPCTSCSFRDCA